MKVIDREWREAADLRPSRVGLALALAAAALLRFWTLGHGVPYMLGVDEPDVMDRAVRMVQTGDFNPHFFDYPSLYMYVQAVVVVARFLLGAVRGEWSSLRRRDDDRLLSLGTRGHRDSRDGERVRALHGRTALGRADGSPRRGAARGHAAARARIPLHSDRRAGDVPRGADASSVAAAPTSGRRCGPFVAAGAAVGLAAATKYNGGVGDAHAAPRLLDDACRAARRGYSCRWRSSAPASGRSSRRAVHVSRSADVPEPVRAAVVRLSPSRSPDRNQRS